MFRGNSQTGCRSHGSQLQAPGMPLHGLRMGREALRREHFIR